MIVDSGLLFLGHSVSYNQESSFGYVGSRPVSCAIL